ncbi:hypothetical protein BVG19_g4431 [[Candida] boidinii]|nr:hypothetical protein BVG19_g4431 [[Candida] boidinii]OWB49863.1 hypothetical protein B5S27_g1408 [[Candida] boidinii]
MDFYSNLDSRSLDKDVPTLFEVVSSNELEHLISPSIRFILVHYTHKYPKYLIRILNSFDEINLLVRSLIEYNTLKNWNSTFTEKFYGLKRVNDLKLKLDRTKSVTNDKFEKLRRLTRLQIIGSVLDIVGVPYLSSKFDLLYEKIYPKFSMDQLRPFENWKDFIAYYFIKIYPVVKFIFKFINLLCQIFYISGKFNSPSFLTYLFKINYSRMSGYDYQLDDSRRSRFLNEKTVSSSRGASGNDRRIRPPSVKEEFFQIYCNLIRPLKKTFLLTTSSIFPASIFLLKFLEWWNSSEFGRQLSTKSDDVSLIMNDKEILPPTVLPSEISTDKKIIKNSIKLGKFHNDRGICYLCNEEIHNPAIIETGYVFCYPCIYKYLSEEEDKNKGGRCPITGKRLLGCRYSDNSKSWKISGIRRLMI